VGWWFKAEAAARLVRIRSVHICGESDLNLLSVCASIYACVSMCSAGDRTGIAR